jgi:hypothetical protein
VHNARKRPAITSKEIGLDKRLLQPAATGLDETSWQEAWVERRAMVLEETISYALEEEKAGG